MLQLGGIITDLDYNTAENQIVVVEWCEARKMCVNGI